jgi:formylglycine-generating enzyme required for sulfatase activity
MRPRTAAIALALAGCTEELPPHGEARVTVHTDMPVPQLVGALRVDLYDDDGWYESREVVTLDQANWPLSFSLYAGSANETKNVLLRLRAYPQGRLREYHGERYEPPVLFEEPWVPASLEQLCDEAKVIVPPATVEVRRGEAPAVTRPIAQPGTDCNDKAHAVTGFHVQIEQAGNYRFQVLDTFPTMTMWKESDTKLFLRASCREPASQLDCNDDLGDGPAVVRLLSKLDDVSLQPGIYTLFIGSSGADPLADVIVRAARADEWHVPDVPPAPEIEGGVDATPAMEPQPAVTIDRLVRIAIAPERVQEIQVALRGECVGAQARVDSDPPMTCIDREGGLSSTLEPDPASSIPAERSFGIGERCDGQEHPDVVCVPGGTFLLGDPAISGHFPPRNGTPERVARISRFWIDRTEVTVARYAAALDAGLDRPTREELVSNAYGMPVNIYDSTPAAGCAWNDPPDLKSDNRMPYGLSCISWHAARAFCQSAGGDLPTEAQWEYAAAAAGRHVGDDPDDWVEVEYPWERNDPEPPTCERATYGRFADFESVPESIVAKVTRELASDYSGECNPAFGPLPAELLHLRGRDVTPGGILGMAGGLSEWVLDAAVPYDHPCWRAAPLDDPMCWMSSAPARVVRGGSWMHNSKGLRGAGRGLRLPIALLDKPSTYVGFRCAYSGPPERRTAPGDNP